MLKVASIAIFVCLVFTGAAVLVWQSFTDDTPEKAIEEINQALKKKDPDLLLPRVTNKPDYVAEKWYQELRKRNKLADPKNKDQDAANSNTETSDGVSPPVNPEYEGRELIEQVIPTELFFSQNRTITKISDVRQNETEAVVQVELGGLNKKTGKKYAPFIYDVLLFKESGIWRAFEFKLRNPDDEKYYLYRFYGKEARSS